MLQGGVPSALVARLDRFIQPTIKLYLYSKPAGAWVFLNGVQTVYLTPASVELNPKMNYRVRLEKEGYEPWEGELAVEKLGHMVDQITDPRALGLVERFSKDESARKRATDRRSEIRF